MTNQPYNISIDYTLQNDLIFLQKINFTDDSHYNANYIYFECDFAMNNAIASQLVYIIVKNLRDNKIYIDFAQFKTSFMKHYNKRFFILKLDWNYELSMNTPLLVHLIDSASVFQFNEPLSNIDRCLDKMLIDIDKLDSSQVGGYGACST